MIVLVAFAALSVAGVAASVVALVRDGHRRIPTRPELTPRREPPAQPSAARAASLRLRPAASVGMRARAGA